MLYVDKRWDGNHGIARFGREVVERLTVPFAKIDSRIRPSSPMDFLNPSRIRVKNGDILYSPGFNAGICQGKQLVTIHDLIHLEVPDEQSHLKNIYYERVLRPTVVKAQMVFTVSETSRRKIHEWLDNDDIDVINVGNGISDAFIREEGDEYPSTNEFLFVGNLKFHKNLIVLLRALKIRPDYRLSIVSSEGAEIYRMASELGVGEQISVLQNVTDQQLARIYRKSAALLFPSILEGFGLPAAEARRCGTRVAYWSGCSAVAEIMDGEGFAVQDAFDPLEWAQVMDACSVDKSAGTSVPSAGWLARYDWHKVAGKVTAGIMAHG